MKEKILQKLLSRFIVIEWRRTPIMLAPLIRIKCAGIVLAEMQWNTLGNFWENPRNETGKKGVKKKK